jgi:hypothetical protein
VSRIASTLALVMLLALTAACTRPADQVETGHAPNRGAAGQGSAAATGGGRQAVGGVTAGDFGTLKKVCGTGTRATVAPDVTGVDGDTISLGVFADPGQSARPGFNQELFDASDVFVSWCNALGGINGFKLKADHHDSALFNVKPEMLKACVQDFFLVGGGSALDDTGEATRLSCVLPNDPGFVVSAASRGAELTVDPIPGPIQSLNWGIARALDAKFPAAKDHIGFLAANLGSSLLLAQQYDIAGGRFGWKKVYDDVYNVLGESNWVPYAAKIASAGVRGLVYVGEPENLGKLVAALAQIGHKLDFVAATINHYDPKLQASADGALSSVPVYLLSQVAAFDQKPVPPAIRDYLRLFQQYKPGGNSRASLGLYSFSAWLLFAESLKKCSTISRKCVYDAMRQTTAWDAGGLDAPADLSSGAAGKCFTVIHATDRGFTVEPWRPNHDIFNCDDENVVAISQKLGDGATLASAGRSMADLK